MAQHLALVTLLVRDYDEAIAFYVEKLGFALAEDTDVGGGKRWVRIQPPGPGSGRASLLLARAVTPEQRARVGDQTGGRVSLFIETDNFKRDYDLLCSRGVNFLRPPKEERYGLVAVFEDLYGNRFDLIQPRA